jgi:16S rRNA (adenine1518-N6/adenine1519-N6)-dimethyltransferase
MDLVDKKQLIEYLQSHGLYTKHRLGQNFLVDREVLDKIVEAAELTPPLTPPRGGGDLVIEVGAGLGTLTQELVKSASEVIAVELDEKLTDILISNFKFQISNKFPNSNFKNLDNKNSIKIKNCKLKIVNTDILKVNLNELVGERKYKVVANIPYYITSKIINLFLTAENKPESIVMLVQKEVAERICAQAGEMSILSLSVQAFGEPKIIDIVPRESFFPAPDVDSAILKVSSIGYKVSGIEEKELFRIIKIGFSARRKTLLNNLSSGLHLKKEQVSDIIKRVDLSENVRAQELSLDQWAKLTKIFSKL